MKRLTKRNTEGKAIIDFKALGVPFGHDTVYDIVDLYYVACVYLSDYEDTNFTPSDIADLRNFACQLCGKYKEAHNGACDSCRWRKDEKS